MKSLLVFSVLSILACVAAYSGLIWMTAVPYRYLDLNQYGFVGYGDAVKGLDLGHRIDSESGCSEVFSLKDGLTVATFCGE